MKPEDVRRRAVGYLVVAAIAGTAWWAVSRGAPLHTELGAVRAHLARLEATTREARDQTVRSGGAGIDDSIAAARSRYEATAERVPPAGTGESDAELRRLVAALAERHRVVVRSSEEAPGERSGPLIVSTFRISAEGAYHDLGRWLASVEAARRLILLGGATLGAAPVPDAVTAQAAGGPGAPPAIVRFEGSFRWFRQDSVAARQDSTLEAN